ncbi:hypothetical protein NMG60_11025463 [Bertholletia excelsa]
MEEFFQYDSHGPAFWAIPEASPANQSAFVRYSGENPRGGLGIRNEGNVHRRMVEMLRRMWMPMPAPAAEGRENCYRHMMNERMRREKQKLSYSALHSLLPRGTKSDKNSIVQEAAKEIQELEKRREELQRRNMEMETIIANNLERENVKKGERAKIRIKVANPSSGTDSMLEVLKCLKKTGSSSRAIRSNISAQEMTAVVEVESEMGAGQVEEAVQRALLEAEWKLRGRFPVRRNCFH